jgi:hypothetical protein
MTRAALPPDGGLACRLGLADRLAAIEDARSEEREILTRRGITSVEVAHLRRLTLHALEAYACDLERLAWPVPRMIQQDIRLRRALLTSTR